MTPEEEFNKAVWWTLQDIKLGHLFAQLQGGDIYFEIKDKYNAPEMDNQRKAVEFLERREAIKVTNQKYPIGTSQIGAELYNPKPIGYNLYILQPKFDELYKSYGDSAEIQKRAILETISATDIQEVTPDPDILTVRLKNGSLILNKNTGLVKFNRVEVTLNPAGREFKIIFKLMGSKNYHATYKNLLDGNVSKTSKRNLGFSVRNLKETLGILPAEKAKNKDCIANIKGYGYKLITA